MIDYPDYSENHFGSTFVNHTKNGWVGAVARGAWPVSVAAR